MATGLTKGSRNSCQEKVSILQKGTDLMNKERGRYSIVKLRRSDHGADYDRVQGVFRRTGILLISFLARMITPYLMLFQIYILRLNKKRGDLILAKKKVRRAVLSVLLIVAEAVKKQSRTKDYD